MSTHTDSRISQRISIKGQVQVCPLGRMASYALAINISMGGLLLSASPRMPVGSLCDLAIDLSGNGAQPVLTKGTVIRSDDQGTAIRFMKALDETTYETLAHPKPRIGIPMLNAYVNYFKVSQRENQFGSETLLGVNSNTFRRVFLATFFTCIPLSALPVWILQSNPGS